jgi:hypothetical protein
VDNWAGTHGAVDNFWVVQGLCTAFALFFGSFFGLFWGGSRIAEKSGGFSP